MNGVVTKIWIDVIEVSFSISKNLPKVNTVLVSDPKNCVLLVKKILNPNQVLAIVIDSLKPIKINDKMVNTNKSFLVQVGKNSKGHIFDYSGISYLKQDKPAKLVEMDSTIKPFKQFSTEYEVIETGIKAIDFFIPILKGSKIGIFGGAGVGKTVLMKEIIFNLLNKNELLKKHYDIIQTESHSQQLENHPFKDPNKKQTTAIFVGCGERSREAVELYKELKESDLMKDSVIYVSRMNEFSGSRMSIVPIGVTAAEYLRDEEKNDVLLFVDNIFRYLQAGSEVSSSLDKKPSIGGYQPTLNTDIAYIQNRLFANENGSITSFQTVFLPLDDLNDPSAVATFKHLTSSLVLSREITANNIYPAFDPIASNSDSVDIKIIGKKHYEAILEAKLILKQYKDLEDVIFILGYDSLNPESKEIVKKAKQLQNFFSQNLHMSASFTRVSGVYVPLEKTVDCVCKILAGEYSQIDPENFLYIDTTAKFDEEIYQKKLEQEQLAMQQNAKKKSKKFARTQQPN